MGIQDRDDYWEKHKQSSRDKSRDTFGHLLNQSPSRYRHSARNRSGIRYLIYPAIMLGALWYGADDFLKYRASSKPLTLPPIFSNPSPAPSSLISAEKPETLNPIIGGLVLKADRQGHFRGTVLINNVPMPFLIDTGATTTTIPEKLAAAAHLPMGRSIQTHTAGGLVVGRLTQLTSLRLGNAEIRHLDANINQYVDEVLIGMNTLKHFHITQTGNTMTLTTNADSAHHVATVTAGQPEAITVEQPVSKRPTTIKKTVTCDEHKVCVTQYSDH